MVELLIAQIRKFKCSVPYYVHICVTKGYVSLGAELLDVF